MKVKNIILDPGHGGIDKDGNYTTAPNKMFKFPDGLTLYEGEINREIVLNMLECFKDYPEFNVITTVSDARDIALKQRVNLANYYNPAETIFISIHCNAGGGTGFEIFTTKGENKSDILAEEIANAVEHIYKREGLGLRYDTVDGDKDKEEQFYVIRKTLCPAVLIECGFFDNRKDAEHLIDPVFQGDIASFYVTGILNYISKQA
jgi:N-acetylmuramoyl-L-alanine amidase